MAGMFLKILNGVPKLKSVLSEVLEGLSTATATAVTAADSILSAIGKLQAQINNLGLSDLTEKSFNSLTDKPTIPSSHNQLSSIGTKTHDELESEISDIQDAIPVSVSDATEKEFTSPDYVLSRGQNLISNGTGLLENNYNFQDLDFDANDTFAGAGSFKTNEKKTVYSDEFIPINPDDTYLLELMVKSGDIDGSNYVADYLHYIGIAVYDIDKLVILPSHHSKYPSAVDTTLAQPLNNGDSVAYLTNATGWYNTTNSAYREMSWFPYTNGKGYTYPDYTYTRNLSKNYSEYLGGVGLWPAGGISGNTITLSSPWPGPSLPAGTKVRNCYSAGAYKYLYIGTIPNLWVKKSGIINGTAATPGNNTFSPGTAYVKFLHLPNYNYDGTTNSIRLSGISFSKVINKLILSAKSVDEDDPPANSSVIWQSDGTDSGNDGDILIKATDSVGITTFGKIDITPI